MHPYTLAWLARHAVPLTIAAIQIGIIPIAMRQRRFGVALILVTAVAPVGIWLGPSLIALACSTPLPSSTWEPAALAAPFLAVAAAAFLRRQARPAMDLHVFLPVWFVPHGLAAILMWLSIALSGALTTGAARRTALSIGLIAWAAIDVLHANRFSVSSVLGDPDGQTVAAAEASLAAVSWTALGRWMVAHPELVRAATFDSEASGDLSLPSRAERDP